MKKKPASVPETPKASTAKAGRTSKTDAAPAAETAKSHATDKPRRAPRQPLLDAAVDSVKKMFKPKAAPKKSAAAPKVEVEAPTVVRRSYTRDKKEELLDVPPILLEGDAPTPRTSAVRAKNFPSAPRRPTQSFSGGELPESYGTKKLFLTARDPHWLYANWDLTPRAAEGR